MISIESTGSDHPTPPAPESPRDRGSSILLVLACLTAIAIFATVTLNASVNTLKTADRSEDWNQALSAAEAGVSDYLARLNEDDSYWQKTDCTNPALQGPAYSGCGYNATTAPGWRQVPGDKNSSFHYDVDATSTYANGRIVLTSTGKVRGVTRTVQTRLRRDGFGEFLYYTMYETIDPADEKTYGINNTQAQSDCTRYNWPTLPASEKRKDYCADITFISGDSINGPLHTNDAFLVTGTPRFKGTTTTSNPNCRASTGAPTPVANCYLKGAGANPTFERGIAYRPEIQLPTALGDLRQYVTVGQTPTPGCLFTGPTRIKFLPTSGTATPQMTVWSKWTTASQLNSGCGTVSQLTSTAGATIDVPQDRLILVQDVPSTQVNPTSSSCKTTGGIGDGLPQADVGPGSYPNYDYNLTFAESNCRYGTVYVQGTLKGRTTIAADNNIIATGNITYAAGRTGTDVLGLIAKNSVKVYHPVRCTARDNAGTCTAWANLAGSVTDVEINASILTLQHSFTVQSYYLGAKLGTLKLYGSFAQRFRGPVGTNNSSGVASGYLKDYTYDTRLRYAPPPFFLDPVRSGWGQKTFGEIETPAKYRVA